MARNDTLQGFTEVHQQMEAIGNLDGLWCAARNPIGIDARPITADNGDAGMLSQPGVIKRQMVGDKIEHEPQPKPPQPLAQARSCVIAT